MSKWIDKPIARIVAMLLAILIALNLLPSKPFRSIAEVGDAASVTVKLMRSEGQAASGVSVGFTLTDEEDSSVVLTGNVVNGVGVVTDAVVGHSYRLAFGFPSIYCYEESTGTFFYQPDSCSVSVGEGGATQEVLLELAESLTFKGRVTDESYGPLEGATVRFSAIAGYSLMTVVSAVTDASGEYSVMLPGMPGAAATMQVSKPGKETKSLSVSLPAALNFESVMLEKATFTITPVCGENGSMQYEYGSFTEAKTVDYGTTATIVITPDEEYRIQQILDNGTVVSFADATGHTLVLENITENHTISATFVSTAEASYQLGIKVGAGGTLNYLSDTLTSADGEVFYDVNPDDATVSYTVVPEEGYLIADISVNGVNRTLSDAQKESFSEELTITEHTSITVSFSEKPAAPVSLQVVRSNDSAGSAQFVLGGSATAAVPAQTDGVTLQIVPADGYCVLQVVKLDEQGTVIADITASVKENAGRSAYVYAIPAAEVVGALRYRVVFGEITYQTVTSILDNEYFEVIGNNKAIYESDTLLYVNNGTELIIAPKDPTHSIAVNKHNVLSPVYATDTIGKVEGTVLSTILIKPESDAIDAYVFITLSKELAVDEVAPSIEPATEQDADCYLATGWGAEDAGAFVLSVYDNNGGSGVQAVYYGRGTLGNTPEVLNTMTKVPVSNSTVKLTSIIDGTYTFYAVDGIGNVSEPLVVSFRKDVAAPKISMADLYSDEGCETKTGISIAEEGYVSAETVYLKLMVSDNKSGLSSVKLYKRAAGAEEYTLSSTYAVSSETATLVIPFSSQECPGFTEIAVVLTDTTGNETDYIPLSSMSGALKKDAIVITNGEVSITTEMHAEATTAVTEVNGVDVYAGAPAISVTLTDSLGLGIKGLEILLNGTPVTADANGVSISATAEYASGTVILLNGSCLSGLKDGANEVKISCKNRVGAESAETVSFYMDTTAPVMSGYSVSAVDAGTTIRRFNGKIYTNGKLNITIKAIDQGAEPVAGLDKIKLYSDGTLLEAISASAGQSEYTFVLFENETAYTERNLSFVIADALGNERTITLPIASDGESGSLVYSGEKPELAVTVKDAITYDEKTWTKTNPVLEISGLPKNGEGLWKYEVLVNGVSCSAEDWSQETSLQEELSLEVDTSSLTEADEYNIEVKLVSGCGNEALTELTVYVDRAAPAVQSFTVQPAGDGSISAYSYGVFTNGQLSVKVSALDMQKQNSGVTAVDTISLLVNGELFDTKQAVNGTGEYTFVIPAAVLAAGEKQTISLSAYATDMVGNEGTPTALTTANANLPSQNIVIETIPSEITISTDAEATDIDGKKWYGENITVQIDVAEQDSAIESIEITCNGTIVEADALGTTIVTEPDNTQGPVQQLSIRLKTEDLTSTDGAYHIVVKVKDIAGNETEEELSFHIDLSTPVIEGFTLAPVSEPDTLNFLMFGTFASGKVRLTVNVSDAAPSAGLSTVVLRFGQEMMTAPVNGGQAVFEIPGGMLSDGYSESFSFSATVSDKLGHTGDSVSVNTENSNMLHDSLMIEKLIPTIAVEESGDNRYEAGEKIWYSSDVTWKLSVKDEGSGIASVSVKLNGTELTVDNDGRNISEAFASTEEAVMEETFVISTAQGSMDANNAYTLTVSVKDNAGNVSETYTATVYKDVTAPEIERFRFEAVGYVEGSEMETGVEVTEYGFYFKQDATVYIVGMDAGAGVAQITYYLKDLITGSTEEVTAQADSDGAVSVVIKAPFKGQIYAKAEDNVANACDYVTPKSTIIEDDDNHDLENHFSIVKNTSGFTQANGVELFSSNVEIGVTVIDRYSGIRSVEWSVTAPVDTAKNQNGRLTIENDGTLTGDNGWTKKEVDQNLVTAVSKTIVVSNDSNDIVIRLKMTDRSGNSSERVMVLGIDKTAPTVEYYFDNNHGDPDYAQVYNAARTMTIIVTERNFNPADFQPGIRNTDGSVPTLSAWTEVKDTTDLNKTTHTATVTFAQDGNYTVGLAYADRAGNRAMITPVPSFIIDTVKPVISVSYDNNTVHNEKYFNSERNASVVVYERNFDVSRVGFTGNAPKASNWTSVGDRHVLTVTFDAEGEYTFGVTVTDKAGNTGDPYGEDSFIIDLTAPTVSLSGFQDANKGAVEPLLVCADKNFLESGVTIKLVRSNGEEAVRTFTTEEYTDGELTGLKYIYRNFDNMKENDDIYTFRITVEDKAGNISEPLIRSFSVNRFGSTYDMSALEALNGTYTKIAEDLVFTEVNVDDIDTEQVEITLIRNSVPKVLVRGQDYTVSKVQNYDKRWSEYRYVIRSRAFDEDGEYSINVVSVDKAGNINQSSETGKNGKISFCVDRVAPNVLVISPIGQTVYSQASLDASLEIRDNYKLDKVRLFLNGKEISYSRSNNGTVYTFTIPESDSRQLLRIEASDAAGNLRVVEVADFLVSTNMFVRFINNAGAVLGVLLALLAILSGILALLIRRRKKNA